MWLGVVLKLEMRLRYLEVWIIRRVVGVDESKVRLGGQMGGGGSPAEDLLEDLKLHEGSVEGAGVVHSHDVLAEDEAHGVVLLEPQHVVGAASPGGHGLQIEMKCMRWGSVGRNARSRGEWWWEYLRWAESGWIEVAAAEFGAGSREVGNRDPRLPAWLLGGASCLGFGSPPAGGGEGTRGRGLGLSAAEGKQRRQWSGVASAACRPRLRFSLCVVSRSAETTNGRELLP